MRIIALDVGTKRIGIAMSDALGITAQGLMTFQREKEDELMKYLNEKISSESVKEIVVGLPLNMDGSRGPQARSAEAFAEHLKNKVGVPVKMWDERMSTLQAERVMIAADTSRKKRKAKIDKLAAQLILQSYLTAQK